MPQRVTPKDVEHVGKKLKAPDGFPTSGVLTVRKIIIFGRDAKKYYLVRDDDARPDFDEDDDWDVTGLLEDKYMAAGLYLEPDAAKKLVAAAARGAAISAQAQPTQTLLRREQAPPTDAAQAQVPPRAGARPRIFHHCNPLIAANAPCMTWWGQTPGTCAHTSDLR